MKYVCQQTFASIAGLALTILSLHGTYSEITNLSIIKNSVVLFWLVFIALPYGKHLTVRGHC